MEITTGFKCYKRIVSYGLVLLTNKWGEKISCARYRHESPLARVGGCPIPDSVQGQVRQGFEQSDLAESVCVHFHGSGVGMIFKVLPTHTVLRFYG